MSIHGVAGAQTAPQHSAKGREERGEEKGGEKEEPLAFHDNTGTCGAEGSSLLQEPGNLKQEAKEIPQ